MRDIDVYSIPQELRRFSHIKRQVAEVFRWSLGDCSNKGITSRSNKVLVCDGGTIEELRELQVLLRHNPKEIRLSEYVETPIVRIVRREIQGRGEYVHCQPIENDGWYMAGGTFAYTSDSRFKEITGVSYPISIHDRQEA